MTTPFASAAATCHGAAVTLQYGNALEVGRGRTAIVTDVLDGTHFVPRVHAYDTDAQSIGFQIAH
jgi:hypothetical protein